MSKEENSVFEAQESLLYSARHGEVIVVKSLLEARHDGKLTLDINCKGKSKTNQGWTPLQLATYFGHVEVVKELLEAGADVDEVNETGDTALHKACFIGNEELVILLLNHKADVNIMNGEGRTPCEVCRSQDVQRLVEAARRAERLSGEKALLSAARDGNVEQIQTLLSSSSPPNINCVDPQGNSCLHCASYRGHVRVAVLLLQNGIDTTLRNNCGQLAVDLAKDAEVREVLSVRPVQRLQRSAAPFEGELLKRSRIFRTQTVWAVVQRGVLLYYRSRADSVGGTGTARQKHYLDGATVLAPGREPALLALTFSSGETHRLYVTGDDVPAARQRWVTALNEHISFAGHYLWAGASQDTAREATEDLDDECKPLGSMQDALTAATNNLALFETQLKECSTIVAALDRTVVGNSLHQSAYMRFQHASGSGAAALGALRHCAALVAQTRDADTARLHREIERNRVLEEALAALARTHHALEMSVAEELSKQSKRKKRSSSHHESKENFFDVFDDSDDDDTLVTAGAISPWGSSPELTRRTPVGSVDGERTPTNEDLEYHRPLSGCSELSLQSALSAAANSVVSPATSMGTLVSTGGHVYRNARRHGPIGKPSSQWSI